MESLLKVGFLLADEFSTNDLTLAKFIVWHWLPVGGDWEGEGKELAVKPAIFDGTASNLLGRGGRGGW